VFKKFWNLLMAKIILEAVSEGFKTIFEISFFIIKIDFLKIFWEFPSKIFPQITTNLKILHNYCFYISFTLNRVFKNFKNLSEELENILFSENPFRKGIWIFWDHFWDLIFYHQNHFLKNFCQKFLIIFEIFLVKNFWKFFVKFFFEF
jgi:hypothetical protein